MGGSCFPSNDVLVNSAPLNAVLGNAVLCIGGAGIFVLVVVVPVLVVILLVPDGEVRSCLRLCALLSTLFILWAFM